MRQEWVYIARHETLPVVKIGSSVNPLERACHQGMQLLGAVAITDRVQAEQLVHQMLHRHRYRATYHREWFHLEPALRLFPEAFHQVAAEMADGGDPRELLWMQRARIEDLGRRRRRRLLNVVRRSHRRSVDHGAWHEIFGRADLIALANKLPVKWQRPRDPRGRFTS